MLTLSQTSSFTPLERCGLSVRLSHVNEMCSNLQPQLPGVRASSALGSGEDPSLLYRWQAGGQPCPKTTVILLCPVHSKSSSSKITYVQTHFCAQGTKQTGKWCHTESSISASEDTSQHDVKERFWWGIWLFVSNKKADYCSTPLPERVPAASQNKQRPFSNKITMDVFCLPPWHFSSLSVTTKRARFTHLMWHLRLLSSGWTVGGDGRRRGTLSCIVKPG